MTYELAEEILPFCKNCVEELHIWMRQTQVYDEKKNDECFDLHDINSNLIYKKVCLYSSCLTVGNISNILSNKLSIIIKQNLDFYLCWKYKAMASSCFRTQ